jgi:osmoprotectant transport system substrate-binding protein
VKRIPLFSALAAVAALALAGCGGNSNPLKDNSSGGGSGTVVVGSANFPEAVLLMEIYAGALKAKGVDVSTKPNIGAREAYIKGIEDGSIDLIPEYTGNLRLYFDPKATASDSAGVYKELQASLPKGLAVLDYAQAEDKDAVVVTQATADKYHLKSIADLAPVAGNLKLGGPPEWKTRSTGVPGLKKVYGVTFGDFVELDAGGPLTLNALLDGRVDAGNLFTTDPNISAKHLVPLEDPKYLFAAQNVVPLIRTDALSDKIKTTLNAVDAKLDTATLADLVTQVVIDKQDPADVADKFLSDQGLN